MLAKITAKFLLRHNIHYAWAIMAVTFITLISTSFSMAAPGVLMKAIAGEFSWKMVAISSSFAVTLLLFGLVAPFAASMMIRFGVKNIIRTAIFMIACGLTLSLFAKQIWQFVLFWGVIVGCGAGLTAMVLASTITNRWFSEKRGLVMGILAASNAAGQLAFLPLLASLMQNYGWRSALLLVCALLFVAFIIVNLFLVEQPSDVNQNPYGQDGIIKKTPPRKKTINPLFVLFDAVKVPTFWVLFFTFFVCGASTNGLVQTHFVSFCGDFGMTAVASASVLAMMGIFNLFGTIGSGWLTDRFDARYLLFAYYFFRGISLLFLPHADFSTTGLMPFAVFYGLDWIATVPPTVRLANQQFGLEKGPVVYGWVFAGHQIGAATIAFFAGWVRTAYETYLYAFLIAGILCLIAAVLALFASRNQKTIFV